MRPRKHALVILVLLVTISPLVSPRSSYANPLILTDSSAGSIYSNSTHVHLPEANVIVHIEYLGALLFDVNIACNFTIYSNITQTSTLAFAYPSYWKDSIPSNRTSIFSITMFDITFDGKPVEQREFDWHNATWIPEFDHRWYFISGAPAFVGFNVDLDSYVNHTLIVSTSFRRNAIEGSFSLSYLYGSAQTFEGTVHECITFVVEESGMIREIQFWPNTNLTLRSSNEHSIGTWDLRFDKTDGYSVLVMIRVDDTEFDSTRTVNSLYTFSFMGCMLSVTGVAIGVLRKYRSPE